MARGIQVLCIVATAVAVVSAVYFGWARYRVSGDVLVDDAGFPRSFPYPDSWLMVIHNWLDARNPTGPGGIKFHGELPTLRLLLNGAVVASVAVAVAFTRFAMTSCCKRSAAQIDGPTSR